MGWPRGWTELGANDATKEGTRKETLRVVWAGNGAAPLGERKTRQPVCKAAVLQHYMRWLSDHGQASGREETRAEGDTYAEMQPMHANHRAPKASQGSQSDEQRPDQYRGAVSNVSHGRTQNGRYLGPWGEGWEDGTQRVADGVMARVDRLKAIGNGQVPLCAATAWRELTQSL